MPIAYDTESIPGVLQTILTGRVTDDELLAHYGQPAIFAAFTGPWLELVDGSGVTSMEITGACLQQLISVLSTRLERLRGGRVAMAASSSVVYGIFRMWELQRDTAGYEVSVFRDVVAAREWLLRG